MGSKLSLIFLFSCSWPPNISNYQNSTIFQCLGNLTSSIKTFPCAWSHHKWYPFSLASIVPFLLNLPCNVKHILLWIRYLGYLYVSPDFHDLVEFWVRERDLGIMSFGAEEASQRECIRWKDKRAEDRTARSISIKRQRKTCLEKKCQREIRRELNTQKPRLSRKKLSVCEIWHDFKENDKKPFVLAHDVVTQLPCGSENFEICSLYYSFKNHLLLAMKVG